MSHEEVNEDMSPENMEEVSEDMAPENMESGQDLVRLPYVRLLAFTILSNDYPFDYVEHSPLPQLFRLCEQNDPDDVVPSIPVVKSCVFDLYRKEKQKLKQEFANISNRISLTADLWKSCTTDTYICLTAHFVDLEWKLNSKVLTFCTVDPSADGMCERIVKILSDWGIEKKIFSLTLDDSVQNHIVQEKLKTRLCLQNGLLCEGEHFPVHCFARVLQLIVDEGLKLVSNVVWKIRKSILFVNKNAKRRKKFWVCAAKVCHFDAAVRMYLDKSMSVNSTYLMLESALKYKDAFQRFYLYDDDYNFCPSVEEWKIVENILAFLLPFYQTASIINSTPHPTSNLYFLQVWKVQRVLVERLGDEDEGIKRMAERMMSEFEKYWDEYSVILALGAVLDPRIKLSTLGNCYSRLDASTCERKLQHVKSKLYMLFDKYSSKSTSGVQTTTQDQSYCMPFAKSLSRGLFDEFKTHRQQLIPETRMSQLDIYLDEPNWSFDFHEDLDVLQWWKINNDRFPDLSILACDLLSVPMTTVASTRDFGMGYHVFNKYKDRKLPRNMDFRFCTRSWLYNFRSNDGDDNEDFDGIMIEIDDDVMDDYDFEDGDDD